MELSKQDQKKKEKERFYAQWFINNMSWDSCKLEPNEEPDFGIDMPIGLEVVYLFKDEKRKGSAIKGDESRRQEWLSEEVSVKYHEMSACPIRVKVLINPRRLGGKLKGLTPDLAEKLASELAEKSDIEVWEGTEFEFKVTDKCVLKIFLTRLPDECERYSTWTFVNNHVGWSRKIEEAEKAKIQGKICEKAAKLSEYKKKYDEIILLIVSDRTHESGMFHVDDCEMAVNNCGFLAVYLALFPEPGKIIRIG